MRQFIDRLRELLLPTLALTILATLWVLAKARASEEDLAQGLPPASQALMDKIAQVGAEDVVAPAAPPTETAHADTAPLAADPR